MAGGRHLLALVEDLLDLSRLDASGVELRPVDVIDSGVGMSYRQLTRLFQPFERLDARARGIDGNGLGLAVSKALVEAMHGTIDVASTPGAGSVFSVCLPAGVA